MPIPCHILVEDNPAIIYASRNGAPEKVLPTLSRFLDRFWQERDTSGEYCDTPDCLVAQIIVRFGFEYAEDDYSNLRVGIRYHRDAQYFYYITAERNVHVWVPDEGYRSNPQVGLQGCRELIHNAIEAPPGYVPRNNCPI
jgi:hypothetical protein